MTYYTLLLLIFGTLFGAYLLFLIRQHLRKRRLERYLATASLNETQRNHLRRVPLYNALSANECEHAERLILRFLHNWEFRGIGLQVDDEMRTVVAFHAALMLLYKEPLWLDHVRTLWLYKEGFLAEETFDNGGIVSSGIFELDGQSSADAVVLSWEDARHEAYGMQPYNVIIHEFAHAFDFADGAADGMPPMQRDEAALWDDVLDGTYDALFEHLQQHEDLGIYEPFGEYAAENEAEFFAVSSELFYGCPSWLHDNFPELFGLLSRFYGTDPRRWGVEAGCGHHEQGEI